MPDTPPPLVGVIMGSESDWEPVMEQASTTLTKLGIPHENHVRSAHRLPDLLAEYSRTAKERGIRLIIAGAGGGAAHLPGMAAAQSELPIIGVPVDERSVPAIREMPRGTPVATMSTGRTGAENAAVFAAEILAHDHPEIARLLAEYKTEMRRVALEQDRRIHGGEH